MISTNIQKLSQIFTRLDENRIEDRRKQLFTLVHKIKKTNINECELTTALQNLQPKTILENNFKIDILLMFRRFHELLDLLNTEDKRTIKRIVKNKWIFADAFEQISSEMLIELMSKVSYYVRLVIIRKLSKHFKKKMLADTYFEAIFDTYGLKHARLLLPACSEKKIYEITKKYGGPMNDKVVLRLVQANPHFLKEYLQCLKKYDCSYTQNYYRTLSYLANAKANKTSNELLEIFYDIYITLGDYQLYFNVIATRWLLVNHLQDVVANARHYCPLLRMTTVMKVLREKNLVHDFFCNLFPANFLDFSPKFYNDEVYKSIKAHPRHWYRPLCILKFAMTFSKDMSFDYFCQAFKRRYNNDFLSIKRLVTRGIMHIIHCPEMRRKIVEEKLKMTDIPEDSTDTIVKQEHQNPYLLKKRLSTEEKMLSHIFTSDASNRVEHNMRKRKSNMKLMPESEKIDNNQWYIYLPLDESMVIYKNLIKNAKTFEKRTQYLIYCIETISYNGDTEQHDELLELLRCIVLEHNSIPGKLKVNILETLRDQFTLHNLGQKHWFLINEIMKHIIGVGRTQFRHFRRHFILGCIHMRLKHNLSIKDQVLNYLRTCESFYKFNILRDFPQYEQKVLTVMAYVISEHFNKEDTYKIRLTYILAIVDWNRRHKHDRFVLSSCIVGFFSDFKNMLEKGKWHYLLMCTLRVVRKNDSILMDMFDLHRYEDKLYSGVENYVEYIRRILRTDPCKLTSREFENLLTHKNRFVRTLTKYILLYEHLHFPNCLLQKALNKIDSCERNLVPSLIACSYILPVPNYINLITLKFFASSTIHTAEKLDTYASFKNHYSNVKIDNHMMDYRRKQLQKVVLADRSYLNKVQAISGLKNAGVNVMCVNALLRYCNKDNFTCALNVLFAVVQYIPESFLQPVFEAVASRSGPMKKYAVRLVMEMGTLEYATIFVMRYSNVETDLPLLKYICKNAIKHLVENPSKESFSTVEKCCKHLDVTDDETFDLFLEYGKIHQKYSLKSIEFAWNLFETASEEIKTKRQYLLKFMSKEAIQESPEFCERVLKEGFLVETPHQNFLERVAYFYIFAAPYHEQVDRVVKFIDILNARKNDYDNDIANNKFRVLLADFFKYSTDLIMHNNVSHVFIDAVFLHFCIAFDIREYFKERIQLEVLAKYRAHSFPKGEYEQLSAVLVDYFTNIYKKVELAVALPVFVDIFQTVFFVEPVVADDDGEMDFLLALLECSIDNHYALLLIINLLPKRFNECFSIREKHLSIIKRLKTCSDDNVITCLGSYCAGILQ